MPCYCICKPKQVSSHSSDYFRHQVRHFSTSCCFIANNWEKLKNAVPLQHLNIYLAFVLKGNIYR